MKLDPVTMYKQDRPHFNQWLKDIRSGHVSKKVDSDDSDEEDKDSDEEEEKRRHKKEKKEKKKARKDKRVKDKLASAASPASHIKPPPHTTAAPPKQHEELISFDEPVKPAPAVDDWGVFESGSSMMAPPPPQTDASGFGDF